MFDRAAVAARIFNDVRWLESGSDAVSELPEHWQPIANGATAIERIDHATALLSPSLLEQLPRFRALLQSQLVDVVPALLDNDQYVLLYVTRDGEKYATWIGTDPRCFGSEPATWDKLPSALQHFLRNTHPSFGLNEYDTYGFTHPSRQVSLYERSGLAEVGVTAQETWIGEYDGSPIYLNEIHQLSWDMAQQNYVTSPRFAPGELALRYQADFEMVDFWPSLDDMLCMGYQHVVF